MSLSSSSLLQVPTKLVVTLAAVALLAVAGCTEPREPVGAVPSDASGAAGAAPSSSSSTPSPHTPGHDRGGDDIVRDTDTAASVDSQGRLRVGGLAWHSPQGWMPQAPRTAFAEWEYVLPGSEQGREALLTMGYTGGTVEQNILRWKAQLGEGVDDEVQRTLENSHVPVTLYRALGTLRGQPGMMTVALLFEYQADAGVPPLVYVRVNGPEATVRAHLERIKRFGKTAVPESHLEPAEQDE